MLFLRIFLSDKKALLHAVIWANELQCVEQILISDIHFEKNPRMFRNNQQKR